MFLFRLIRTLVGLYSLLLLANLALPYVTKAQQPWMAVLSRICEPGVKIGNLVAAKLLPDRRFKVDMGAVAAVLLCWIARLLLGLFV